MLAVQKRAAIRYLAMSQKLKTLGCAVNVLKNGFSVKLSAVQ